MVFLEFPDKYLKELERIVYPEWAGERIVGRGKSYRRHVENLCTTPDGALVATVYGTEEYATRAGMDSSNELFSECTCPYS